MVGVESCDVRRAKRLPDGWNQSSVAVALSDQLSAVGVRRAKKLPDAYRPTTDNRQPTTQRLLDLARRGMVGFIQWSGTNRRSG